MEDKFRKSEAMLRKLTAIDRDAVSRNSSRFTRAYKDKNQEVEARTCIRSREVRLILASPFLLHTLVSLCA